VPTAGTTPDTLDLGVGSPRSQTLAHLRSLSLHLSRLGSRCNVHWEALKLPFQLANRNPWSYDAYVVELSKLSSFPVHRGVGDEEEAADARVEGLRAERDERERRGPAGAFYVDHEPVLPPSLSAQAETMRSPGPALKRGVHLHAVS
jgi:hypothetical protein